ncbi:hypothetical protein GMJAKD_12750 [Candidatus Electrothrix aarhusensis]
MNAKLSLHHNGMSDEDIQELTIDLKNSVNQETELIARLPEEAGGPGTKGDAVTLGQMFLAALSSGTVVALLQLLKAYIERTPKITITIEHPDGRKISIEGEDLKAGQLEQTTEAMKQLCEQTSDKGNG